jgi:hypothetical protein
MTIVGKIAPPVIGRVYVLVFSLSQQSEVEHCICVIRRDPQRLAQAFDGRIGALSGRGAPDPQGEAAEKDARRQGLRQRRIAR